ncbi:MAG: hypothetical protein LAP39_10260 [Acidobacteriia bacterium]|nr:hypothetical protein [Terriglobia bacterium]
MRSRYLTLGAFVLFLAAEFPLGAQYPGGYPPGGYPPGGYPPGGYPPGGVGGIPMPRRGKKKTSKKEEDQAPLASMNGMLRKLDDQSVLVEPEDTRIVNLKRTSTTKFSKDGAEMKPGDLKPGDHIQVEYRQDEDGYLFAVNINFEKEGTAEERAKASEPVEMISAQGQNKSTTGGDERPVQRRKDSAAQADADKDEDDEAKPAPAPAKTAPAKASAPAAELPPIAPPEAGLDLDHIPAATSSHPPADDDDSAPHRLTRNRQARQKAPQQVATNYPPADATERAPAPPPSGAIQPRPLDAPPRPETVAIAETQRPPDPRIEKAREAAAMFTESLPNYVCQEQMARFASQTHVVSWQPIDIVSAEVVYENGKEHYRKLAVNGKPAKKKMAELGGSWSTGEFGTVLVDVLSAATDADFRFRKRARAGNRDAYVFDLDVDHEHSHWHIEAPSQYVLPAYRGSIWIDKETSRVLRIEMQAYHMPEEFPFDKVESATDYEFVRIGGDREFLLPVHAETLTCERGTNICSRNVIDFRNYHKYAGEADIKFEK